ncbi:MAG TPA: hypothetical protein VK607_11450, partial [Kofleriaceae bacterium]|nr:hypothetical protein [Kofleriaceae bacterium]
DQRPGEQEALHIRDVTMIWRRFLGRGCNRGVTPIDRALTGSVIAAQHMTQCANQAASIAPGMLIAWSTRSAM